MENVFQPIAVYELPPHIIEVIVEKYNFFTLVNAFKGDVEGYKLELIFENGAVHIIYVDNDGHIHDSKEDS